jgi:poly(3-hydroxybutyrate) depolymerase
MALKKYSIIALVVIMAMVLSVGSSIPAAADPVSQGPSDSSPGLHTSWMTENSSVNSTWVFNRTFEYYIPSSYNESEQIPLLFSFCGLGSNGSQQRDLSKFDVLAERAGFIAVFPDATNLTSDDPGWSEWSACMDTHNWSFNPLPGSSIMWNCGVINGTPIAPLQYCAGVDDAGFVADMVNWFEDNYAINASRIYATGMSNGAMFSYFLAFNLTGTFAAIAPVTGPMDYNLGWNATTIPAPTTVIAIRSPTDPIIPEAGECSPVFPTLCTNYAYSTNDTIKYWCEVDGINMTNPGPVITTWNSTAGIITYRYVYSGGMNGTQVILFWEVGCQKVGSETYCIGHTWPGGPQYEIAPLVGLVDNEIDGSGQIWKYLPPVPKYYLRTSSTYTSTLGVKFNTFGETHYGGEVTTPGEGSFFYAANINATVVNITATPHSKYRFVNWTGDVSTVGNVTDPTTTITINPNTDYQITANFIAQYDLTTGSTSGGSVTTPGQGTYTYDVGTVVPLVATPASGYHFANWTGPVANTYIASTTITMNGDRSVTANFEETTPSGGGGCFIATAAYGTPTAKQIDVLRAFRDDVLLKSTVGSRLVDFYYRTSPPIADFISQHNVVRTLVRELLIDPIVWVVQATENMWQS